MAGSGRTGNYPGHALHNTGLQPPVNVVQEAFSQQFSHQAAAKDSFHQLMRQTFSRITDPKTKDTASYNYNKAEALRQQAVKGDLSWLPEVKVLSNSDFSKAQLNGQQPSTSGTALGAFGDDTIMLNESVLSDPGLALRVYAEEAGHALDKVLNQEVDSTGDEGAIFQKLLSGDKISAEQMNALKAENDHGVLGGSNAEFRIVSVAEYNSWAIKENKRRINVYKNIFAVTYWDTTKGSKSVLKDGNGSYFDQLVAASVRGDTGFVENLGKKIAKERGHGLKIENSHVELAVKTYNAHLAEVGRKNYIRSHIVAVAYQNSNQGLEGAKERYQGLLEAYMKGEAGKAELTTIGEQIVTANPTMDKAKVDAAVAEYNEVLRRSYIARNVIAVAYQNSVKGLEGAKERFVAMQQAHAKGKAGEAELAAFTQQVVNANPTLDKAGVDAAVEASRTDHIKRNIIAVAYQNVAQGLDGALERLERLQKAHSVKNTDAGVSLKD